MSSSKSTSPFIPVDPSLITIPQPSSDSTVVIQCLNKLKDAIVSINHNLTLAIDGIKNNKSEIDRDQHDINLLNTTNTNILMDLTTFQGALNRVITTVATLGGTGSAGTSTGAVASAAPRKPKLQEPAKFDRTDKNKVVAFRVAITYYLRITYPSASVDEQIAYIQSCLEGKASEWLDPYQEQDVVLGSPVAWLHNVTDFWTKFNSRWNVQNKKENNCGKLRQLTQTKSIQEYHKDFQTYSQGLGYNDISLCDMFYDGLTIKIKETMVLQDYDHMTVTFAELAARAMLIESRLDAFKAQNKTASTSKSEGKSLTASSGSPRTKLTVGDDVYMMKDNKAVKGKITKMGKNSKGKSTPTVKWDDGTTSDVKFKALKKDNYPTGPNPTPPSKPSSLSQGPGPMDLDIRKSILAFHIGGSAYWFDEEGLSCRDADGAFSRVITQIDPCGPLDQLSTYQEDVAAIQPGLNPESSCVTRSVPTTIAAADGENPAKSKAEVSSPDSRSNSLQNGFQKRLVSMSPGSSRSSQTHSPHIDTTTNPSQLFGDLPLFLASEPGYPQSAQIISRQQLDTVNVQNPTEKAQPAGKRGGNKDHLCCPHCGKQCRRPVALKEHIRTHEKEKPAICPFENCNTGFATKGHMRRHFATHRAGTLEEYELEMAQQSSGIQSGKVTSVPPAPHNPHHPVWHYPAKV
ncbi:hypothetical protein RSAG8_06179, partial [Rhizoctonia solani AG-8 WAC10335]